LEHRSKAANPKTEFQTVATMDEEVAASESRKETTEVAPALIAVHPNGHHIAVAVGPDLRVFNLL